MTYTLVPRGITVHTYHGTITYNIYTTTIFTYIIKPLPEAT